MNTILEQYKYKINGIFSFFDSIIIKGLQFTVPYPQNAYNIFMLHHPAGLVLYAHMLLKAG